MLAVIKLQCVHGCITFSENTKGCFYKMVVAIQICLSAIYSIIIMVALDYYNAGNILPF